MPKHTSCRKLGPGKMWNMGMSFPGNKTCSQEIFHSNTLPFRNFYAVNKKFTLSLNRLSSCAAPVKLFYFPLNFFSKNCDCSWAWWANMSHYPTFWKSSHLIQNAHLHHDSLPKMKPFYSKHTSSTNRNSSKKA